MTASVRPTSGLSASPRQVGYWIDCGWLRPSARGSGQSYSWTDAEWRVAQTMCRLVQAGLQPEVAHAVARAGGAAEIADGITVSVDEAAA